MRSICKLLTGNAAMSFTEKQAQQRTPVTIGVFSAAILRRVVFLVGLAVGLVIGWAVL